MNKFLWVLFFLCLSLKRWPDVLVHISYLKCHTKQSSSRYSRWLQSLQDDIGHTFTSIPTMFHPRSKTHSPWLPQPQVDLTSLKSLKTGLNLRSFIIVVQIQISSFVHLILAVLLLFACGANGYLSFHYENNSGRLVLVGPTGAGKSSLANALLGCDPRNSSCIFPV